MHHLKQSHNVTVSGSLNVLLCEIAVSGKFLSILVDSSLSAVAMEKFEAEYIFRSKYFLQNCNFEILAF